MTSISHALVAASLAGYLETPLIVLPMSFVSHFVLDAIPHWDFGTNWRERPKWITGVLSISDTIMGITLAYFLYRGKVEAWLLFASIGVSLLPDWLETPWYIFYARHARHGLPQNASLLMRASYLVKKSFTPFHQRASFPLGVITQIVAVGLCLIVFR